MIAFGGVVPPASVGEVIVVGFALKVAFMMCAAPLLRLNRYEETDDGVAAIAIR